MVTNAKNVFTLYVSGPFALQVTNDVRSFFDEKLGQTYRLEVIDVLTQPLMARSDGVIATPTLIRRQPKPEVKLVGNLANLKTELWPRYFAS